MLFLNITNAINNDYSKWKKQDFVLMHFVLYCETDSILCRQNSIYKFKCTNINNKQI